MQKKLLMKKIVSFSLLVLGATFVNAQKIKDTLKSSNIDEVVITGAGYAQKVKDAPATISVISQADIKKRAYRDITDALQDIPGVFITGGGSTSDFSIRGAESGQTLVLIDGKRINTRETRPNSDGPGIEQGWMPPLETIERIEVVKGPMSSLYGSDAMGGVINIITKKLTDRWKGSVGTSLIQQVHKESGNTYQIDGYAAGSIVKDLLQMKITGSYSDRNEDTFVGGFTERVIKAFGTELSLTPDQKNVFKLNYDFNRQERNQTPGYSLAPNAKSSRNNYERNVLSLSHKGDYSNFHTNSYLQYDNTNNPNRDMRYQTFVAYSLNNFNIKKHVISFGGEYRYEKLIDFGNKIKSEGEIINELTRWNWSAFAEGNWSLFDKLHLVTGARLDNDQNYGSNFTPRGYLVWNVTNNFTLKGGTSWGYKAPGLRAVNPGWGQVTGGGTSDGVIIGNKDLKPEKSFNQEVTVMFEDNKKVINLSVTGFNTDFKNKLVEVRKCNNTEECKQFENIYNHVYDFISTRENLGKANSMGIEANLGVNVTKSIVLKTNYTYTDTKIKSDEIPALYNKPYARIPKHMANVNLSWKANDSFEFWSRGNYRSESQPGVNRGKAQEYPIPSYFLWDLGTVYRLNKNVRFTFGVYNILDKNIRNDASDPASNFGFRIDGIRYQFGANYLF
ncbi:Colicin I receptor [Chryseobacterium sp. Bi04]|nr:Colicin I receptor [Chryseobacterium sp. Bi04]